MTFIPDPAIGPVIASVISAVAVTGIFIAGGRLERRKSKQDDRLVLRRESASMLRDALEDLQAKRYDAVHGKTIPTVFAAYVLIWEKAWQRHSHRLPDGAQHLNRSVKAALSEALGSVVMAKDEPDTAAEPFADYDPTWNENAQVYLDYCLGWLNRWHDEPTDKAIMTFDEWLHRRDERYRKAMDGTDTLLGAIVNKVSPPDPQRRSA
ncbi:hypothetical protein ABFT23_02230 [Nocardioides sp. C4-1]|uniref:hypothetical protein n=1 Tax=Nocardioides sp. C4-1 TaxID=3151851 RepID=UPI003266F68F